MSLHVLWKPPPFPFEHDIKPCNHLLQMAKLDKEGKLHRQEKSSRRKITALSNSLLSQRDHTLTSLPSVWSRLWVTYNVALLDVTYPQCLD